jgi:Concanavalin A-like lectin/glucanases superfamily
MVLRLFVSIILFQTVLQAATLDVGLIAHYTFDGNKNDSSGNNFNFETYTGTNYYYGGSNLALVATTYGADKLNSITSSSVYLDGSTTLRANIPPPPYPNNNSWTWSVWLKPTQLGVDRFILSRTDFLNDWTINPVLASTGLNSAFITNDNLYSTTSLSENVWSHIVVTSDQDGTRCFYFDGNIDAQSGSHVLYQDLGVFNIGALQNSPGFQGYVDDVRIFNRALSASEVSNLYATESVPEPSGFSLLVVGLSGLSILRRRRS